MQETNEFEDFDTEKLLDELKKNDTRMVVLLSCRRFGMTTQQLAEKDAPNSREGYVYDTVRKALTWLTYPPEGTGWPPLLEVKTPKLSGRNGRPPNLWMLTEYGAHVLNLLEPDLEIQPPNPRDALDLAHRFCTLDILGLALASYYPAWGEHSLVNGAQTVRADVFVQMRDANVVIEVEQRLLQRNLGRAVRKFENWERYIRAAQQAGEQLPWRLYLVFNVRAVSLSNLLGKWRDALTRATRNMGGLSYQVYHGQTGMTSERQVRQSGLKAFLEKTSLLKADNWEYYLPSEDDSDWLPDFIDEELYADFENAMEAVCNAEIDMGLPPLIHLASVIHQASYYKTVLQ